MLKIQQENVSRKIYLSCRLYIRMTVQHPNILRSNPKLRDSRYIYQIRMTVQGLYYGWLFDVNKTGVV